MKIVIIEDEKLTADDLAETIIRIIPDARITAILCSVKKAIPWFQKNEHPDLVFSDIQLGDGLSFEIFSSVPTNSPIIFCTAYDEYALNAFRANGIDYILKPFDETTLKGAFEKYNNLKNKFSESNTNLSRIIQLFETRKQQGKGSVLVYQKDKILPVKFEDIALFYIENETTHLITFNQKMFTLKKTLEETEMMVSDDYYRVNRQYLINYKAIKEASQYFGRKLSLTLTIPFKETITVSKLKVPDFLEWLSNH